MNSPDEGMSDFTAAASFEGPREGCAFKMGDEGLGYYADSAPTSSLPQPNAVAPPMTPSAGTDEPSCETCGKFQEKLLRCSSCKVATYCSAACQKAGWKAGHKKECAAIGGKKLVKKPKTGFLKSDEDVSTGGGGGNLRESLGLGREVPYKEWKADESGVKCSDFATVLKTGEPVAGVHRTDSRVNAFMQNSGRLLKVNKMNLPPNVPFVWEKLPFPVESSTPYLPLPDMDLKLRALEGGKYIHLSLVPLRDFKPDEQMTMLPALEGISKDEPGFRVIVCDPDQTPPQLMLPHAMPDYATCGQTAPDDGGFRISERYLRFIFRCQLADPRSPGTHKDLVEVLSEMCENNGFELPPALWSSHKRTIVLDTMAAIMLGVITAPGEEYKTGNEGSHDHDHDHDHGHGHNHA